jgi:hypothetical protein
MDVSKLLSRVPIYPLLIGVSLIIGWFIPWFYEWTESDQSRPSPLLWKVPVSMVIASVLFCLALPWLPIKPQSSSDAPQTRIRFSVRTLLIITAGIAIAIPVIAKIPLIASGILCAGAYASLTALGVRNSQHRMAAVALIGCMTLPFIWIIGYGELGRILPELAVIFAGMPAFIPAALTCRLSGLNMHDANWLLFLFTALEIAIGIWMIRLGPKRTIAYLLFVMHLSALGSLALHMLVLA